MGSQGTARLSCRRIGHLAVALLIITAPAALAHAQSNPQPSQSSPRQELPDPTLEDRPPPVPNSPRIPEGKIKLDVVVDDRAGKPVPGLEMRNFKILDNNQSREVMSFRAYDGVEVKTDPPVEVILVIDMVNLPFQQVATVRQQIEQFLKQDGGRLQQPVTVLLLSDAGMRVQPRPSVDGNELVSVLSQIKGSVRVIDSAMGGEGLLERFQLCAREMAAIAENEARKPGRKLLIWVGPGWPMLNRPDLGYYSRKDQQRYFDAIVELSTRLREARMVVYSIAPASDADPSYAVRYQAYLKGVKSPREADSGNLALKVLATQTGGLILGPNNDITGQINRCIEDANAFYQISFDPLSAEHTDEFHSLKISVDKPDVTVRTTTGYYNQLSEPSLASLPSAASLATSSSRSDGATSPPSAPPSLPSADPSPGEFETCAIPSCSVDLPTADEANPGHAVKTFQLSSLGYSPRLKKEVTELDNDEAVVWLGPNQLLLAFNPHGLLRRDVKSDSAPLRKIHAALLDTETNQVLRTADWELPDRGKYLWQLSGNRILVHMRHELRVYDSQLALTDQVPLAGPLAFVRISPNGEFTMVAVIKERHTDEIHARPRDALDDEPRKDVDILILDRQFKTIARATTTSDVMPPILLNEGQVTLLAQSRKRYRLAMLTWENQTLTLARFSSQCIPNLLSFAPDLVFVRTCSSASGSAEFRVLRPDGQVVMHMKSDSQHLGQEAKGNIGSQTFAVKVMHAASPIYPGWYFHASDLVAEEIRVYRATDGKRLATVHAESPTASHDGYSLSPDGSQLAVLSGTQINIYPVPTN